MSRSARQSGSSFSDHLAHARQTMRSLNARRRPCAGRGSHPPAGRATSPLRGRPLPADRGARRNNLPPSRQIFSPISIIHHRARHALLQGGVTSERFIRSRECVVASKSQVKEAGTECCSRGSDSVGNLKASHSAPAGVSRVARGFNRCRLRLCEGPRKNRQRLSANSLDVPDAGPPDRGFHAQTCVRSYVTGPNHLKSPLRGTLHAL